jgi:hypothetical protein
MELAGSVNIVAFTYCQMGGVRQDGMGDTKSKTLTALEALKSVTGRKIGRFSVNIAAVSGNPSLTALMSHSLGSISTYRTGFRNCMIGRQATRHPQPISRTRLSGVQPFIFSKSS